MYFLQQVIFTLRVVEAVLPTQAVRPQLLLLVTAAMEPHHLLQVHLLHMQVVVVVAEEILGHDHLAAQAVVGRVEAFQAREETAPQTLAAVVAVDVQEIQVKEAAQAAPVSSSLSTPYQAKPYLRSKERPLGNARQVLPVLTILWLLVVVQVVAK